MPGPPFDRQAKTAPEESAYRRGFHQGAWYMLCAMNAGTTFAELRRYLHLVDDWRTTDRFAVVWPPVPPKMKAKGAA